jgi:hypothetical protein
VVQISPFLDLDIASVILSRISFAAPIMDGAETQLITVSAPSVSTTGTVATTLELVRNHFERKVARTLIIYFFTN